MIKDLPPSADLSLIWANLRNSTLVDSFEIPGEIKIVGAIEGEFPVNSHRPIFLEAPKNNEKSHTVGRRHYLFGKGAKEANWSKKRIITLPIYENSGSVSLEKFGAMVRRWENALVPDEIPCIAIAVKTCGFYCDERESQSVAVLSVWHDAVGRILELDWAEGPLEDCITPEWRISSTELLPLNSALAELKGICNKAPIWKKTTFSIYAKPPCLCEDLRGKKAEDFQGPWKHEWRYGKHDDLINDLNSVLEKVKNVFSTKSPN